MTIFKPQSEFPLIKRYEEKFPFVKDNPNVVFDYGDTIYCNGRLSIDLVIHEETHLRQQKEIGLDLWVEKYLNEDQFRLEQEIEAYTNQILSIGDRNARFKLKTKVIEILSGPLYGNIINKQQLKNIL